MSTPIVTARRNLVHRIATLLRKAEAGDVKLSPWQLCAVQQAISQLEEERFAEGEHTMSQAERGDKPIDCYPTLICGPLNGANIGRPAMPLRSIQCCMARLRPSKT
jgi:hypothetical protein